MSASTQKARKMANSHKILVVNSKRKMSLKARQLLWLYTNEGKKPNERSRVQERLLQRILQKQGVIVD